MPALRLDKRIGAHAYIAAGMGISGGNLERDLKMTVFGQDTAIEALAAAIKLSRAGLKAPPVRPISRVAMTARRTRP